MKSKGFTMLELLAVISLMAILIAIAVPSVLTISEKIKNDMYCEKIGFIENGAQLWGEDNYDSLPRTGNKKIKVEDLVVNNYLNKDDTDDQGKGFIEDPRDGSSLNDREVNVFLKNQRVYAEYILNDSESGLCD